MAFVSFSAFGNGGRGRGESRPDDALVYSTAHGNLPSVCIFIYPKLAKEARFIDGDSIEILFDAKDRTLLIRRAKDGLKLSGSKGARPLSVKKTWCDGMPSVPKATAMEKVVVNQEGILSVFPANTSFNGLAEPAYKRRYKK